MSLCFKIISIKMKLMDRISYYVDGHAYSKNSWLYFNDDWYSIRLGWNFLFAFFHLRIDNCLSMLFFGFLNKFQSSLAWNSFLLHVWSCVCVINDQATTVKKIEIFRILLWSLSDFCVLKGINVFTFVQKLINWPFKIKELLQMSCGEHPTNQLFL